MQFGNYDQADTYHLALRNIAQELTDDAHELLFVAVCLADEITGVLFAHNERRSLTIDDFFLYSTLHYPDFMTRMDGLLRSSYLINIWERRRNVLMLDDYTLRGILELHERAPLNLARPRPKPFENNGHYDMSNPRAGFVYIAEAQTGVFKIGKARDPKERVKGFAGAVMPFEIRLIHTIYAPNATAAEHLFHRMFHHKRRAGEWFALSRQEVEWLQTMRAIDPENVPPDFWRKFREIDS